MKIIVKKPDVLRVKVFYKYTGDDRDDTVFVQSMKIRAGDKIVFVTDTPGTKIMKFEVSTDGIS